MANLVLGWELGGNSGHVHRIIALSKALVAAGHRVHLAVQRPSAFYNIVGVSSVWQAPIWPGLLKFGGVAPLGPPASYGDLLVNLGLRSASEVVGIVRAWDAILTALRPDAVIGDFAPGLMLASAGRMPRFTIGTGFTVPPVHLDLFPTLPRPDWTTTGHAPLVEAEVISTLIAAAFDRMGRPISGPVPPLLGGDHALPAVFAPLDPYADHRESAPLSPFLADGLPDLIPSAPAGLFVYLPASDLRAEQIDLICRVAQTCPVTGYLPGAPNEVLHCLSTAGVRLSPKPLSWHEIASTCTAALCNGGMGTVSAALLANRNLIVAPGGIEQRHTAQALRSHDLGLSLLHTAPEAQLDAVLDQISQSPDIARTMSLRSGFSDPCPVIEQAVTATCH